MAGDTVNLCDLRGFPERCCRLVGRTSNRPPPGDFSKNVLAWYVPMSRSAISYVGRAAVPTT